MSSKEDDEMGSTLMSSKEDDEMNKTLMSSKEDDDLGNTLTQEEIKEIVDETTNQNSNNTLKQLNDYLDEIIDKSKSFKDQIKSIRTVENLNEYYSISDYGNKELKFKIFKPKIAYLSNLIYKKIFKGIFGHTFETLANKLINTTNKEEN